MIATRKFGNRSLRTSGKRMSGRDSDSVRYKKGDANVIVSRDGGESILL